MNLEAAASDDDPVGQVGRELSGLLGPLRRSVMRATRAAGRLPELPEAQIEVLRALAHSAMSPGEIAVALNLARSTVSNLLKSLDASRLIERSAADKDLRVATISASPTAKERMARYDKAGSAVLSLALASFTEGELEVLHAAAPLLRRLTDQLETVL